MTQPTQEQGLGKFATFMHNLKLGVLVALLAFLAFVAGGVSTVMKAPGVDNFMQSVSMGLFYLYESNFNAETFDFFWHPAHLPGPANENPVILNDIGLAQQGYNLVIGTHEQAATLVDMDGKTVHKWARRFDEVWDTAPHLPDYDSQSPADWVDRVYWRHAQLYPNGDILVVYESPYRTPYGLGLAKLDKDSNVIWKTDANIHHDTAIGSDGEIYALGQRINERGYDAYPSLKPPFIDDTVLVISPEGGILEEISIIEAFLSSQYKAFLSFMSDNLRGDVMHANTVQYIDGATANRFPFASEGDLLISLREMNVIAVLDPENVKITWAQTGPWIAQHEPVMLGNGNILLFDNQGNKGIAGDTRIIEFEPVSGSIQWSYSGSPEEPLSSPYWGLVQRLDNGNTLILESTNGRALEVTPAGRVVWDYRTLHRKQKEGEELVNPLLFIERFDSAELDFVG